MSFKKAIVSAVATLGLTLALPVMAAAADPTVVSGVVTDNVGNPVQGATVSVVCNGNTLTDTTDASGAYAVFFNPNKCPAGKTAQVVASKGSKNGANSGVVTGHTSINVAVLNVKITAAPELGLIATFGAAILGGGAFLMVRRRRA